MNLLDLIAQVLLVLGAGLIALAAIGMHRFRQPLHRLHVAAKASSTGILLSLLGAGALSSNGAVAIELALTGVFLLLTVPVATHALAAAHLAAQPDHDGHTPERPATTPEARP